jgi:hypothetical protein
MGRGSILLLHQALGWRASDLRNRRRVLNPRTARAGVPLRHGAAAANLLKTLI